MKFGETLYERSVPKWAAYNVHYNEIKHLIKRRTTRGIAEPVPIPGTSTNRWRELEDELYTLLKAQYDNVGLFLRSKYGEVDRRLAHLAKQVTAAQRERSRAALDPTQQIRRCRRLMREADLIGEDIQALSRFSSVQKTAFRKILKKYRKWTHSTELQTRLERDVFSNGHLNLDLAACLRKLSQQTEIITDTLQGSLQHDLQAARRPGSRLGSPLIQASPVALITEASRQNALVFDATVATTSFGQSAGSVTYWIHPDNLDEAKTLILRHMRELQKSPSISRHSSFASSHTQDLNNQQFARRPELHMVYLDNAQRFVQDQSVHKPNKIAVTGLWGNSSEAVVTLSDLTTRGSPSEIVSIKSKDLSKAIGQYTDSPTVRKDSLTGAGSIARIHEYLSENRDVKVLGEVHLNRSRYVGASNSSQVGMWAVLDTQITITSSHDEKLGAKDVDLESGEIFPHAVLEIRWEFGRTPEIVRALDASHLTEAVPGFSLESAVVHAINKELEPPLWKSYLDKDIRRIPMIGRTAKSKGYSRTTNFSSGPSSTDDPADSVFSAAAAQSSTSDFSQDNLAQDEFATSAARKQPSERAKGKIRFNPQSPPRPQQRYWNEFDDGDSDVNPEDTFAIYVDPDETFPGSALFSRMSNAIQDTWTNVKSRIGTLAVPDRHQQQSTAPVERTPLLIDTNVDTGSTGSTTTPTSASPTIGPGFRDPQSMSDALARRLSSAYRPHQPLTRRQTALEMSYLQFYSGLFILGYVLLFMSATILATGRKKARLEVETGVVCGIVAAEVCAVVSMILACMRKMPLGVVHWGIISVAAIGIAIIGFALLVGVIENNKLV